MNFYIQFCCFNGEPCSYFEIYQLIRLRYFIEICNTMLILVLLRLSRSASKPRFFSNIELYRNRGFRHSIDGFSFLVNGAAVKVRPNSTQPQ